MYVIVKKNWLLAMHVGFSFFICQFTYLLWLLDSYFSIRKIQPSIFTILCIKSKLATSPVHVLLFLNAPVIQRLTLLRMLTDKPTWKSAWYLICGILYFEKIRNLLCQLFFLAL